MIIEIYTKGRALSKTITSPSTCVPRVGEEVHLAQDGGYLQGTTRLMVYEVYYRLESNELTPIVSCYPTPDRPENVAQSRQILLEELGWYPADRD